MKTILIPLLLIGISLQAQPVATNALNYQVIVGGTSNGTPFQIINVNVPQRYFLIQNSGITGQVSSVSGTNSLAVAVQMSFDGSNWTPIATYKPSRTNATVDTFQPSMAQLNAFMRITATTTNTITVGVTAVKP